MGQYGRGTPIAHGPHVFRQAVRRVNNTLPQQTSMTKSFLSEGELPPSLGIVETRI